ncbi:UbiH/UbiF family hydroxylase [Georhizobium profundi]|uniref:UbiH/UbiF family hydroxylase n=1 Tax=Georhizobium profundi TaxID=2341112 RepID=A0A3Q8XNU3_9HYPH|nr:UbiH/UbiF family hydroxylase [Georhizobium profundi]AZN71807.1 UbiH/UbiF family hydroxylase [Georhizobium profundi]
MTKTFDAVVIGGGLAGCAAALLLAQGGRSVGFVAPKAPVKDGRTTALLMPSIALLDELDVWSHLNGKTAPLRTMRIADASRRLLRAPTVSFNSSEIDEDAFGHNVANADLLAALDDRIAETPSITRFDQPARSVSPEAAAPIVTLADGMEIEGRLIIAADGRNSVAREAAGIKTRVWSYPQSAIVLTFSHKLPHRDVSTEFHTEEGPFTQVPLSGNRSSLVWVVKPEHAERIMALSPDALNREIEDRLQSILGAVTVDSELQRFPLSGMVAENFGRGAIALVGEAAHLFPPIGAQGLNLGMRDVAELRNLPAHLEDRASVEAAIAKFDRARRPDIVSRTQAVDLLNRSLLNGLLPVQFARAAGLTLLAGTGPVRQLALKEGMKPGSAFSGFGGRLREQIRRQRAGRDREQQR